MKKVLTRREAMTAVSVFSAAMMFGETNAFSSQKSLVQKIDNLLNLAQGFIQTAYSNGCGRTIQEHGFLREEVRRMYGMAQCKVIVVHGFEEKADGWAVTKLWDEMLVPFVSSKNNIEDLSLGQMKGILSGSIKDWGEVGSSSGQIKVRWHSGGAQRRTLAALLSKLGMNVNTIRNSELIQIYNWAGNMEEPQSPALIKNHHGVETYDALAEQGRINTGSLVVGLRGVEPTGLKPIKLGGIFPFSEEAIGNYPVSIPIYFAHRIDQDSMKLAIPALEELVDRAATDRKFWPVS